MKISDVFIIISIFLLLFAILIIAYGLGLYFEQIQVALVIGFGITVLVASAYFFKCGQQRKREENLEQLKELGSNNKMRM